MFWRNKNSARRRKRLVSCWANISSRLNKQVNRVEVGLTEHCWIGISGSGKPHAHSFLEKSPAKPFSKIIATRKQTTVESVIEDLFILKSTASGYENFLRDAFTTLPETSDRI